MELIIVFTSGLLLGFLFGYLPHIKQDGLIKEMLQMIKWGDPGSFYTFKHLEHKLQMERKGEKASKESWVKRLWLKKKPATAIPADLQKPDTTEDKKSAVEQALKSMEELQEKKEKLAAQRQKQVEDSRGRGVI